MPEPAHQSRTIAILPLNMAGAWGGSELLWSSLARLWHGQGHRVHVGIRAWDPMPQPILALQDCGVDLHSYNPHLSIVPRAFAALSRRLGVQRPRRHPLHSWLRCIEPDLLVLSSDCLGGLPGIQLAASLRIPYAYIMQANSESWWPDDDQRAQMNAALDAATGAICFVGERNRDLFELQLGRRLAHSMICRNPHAALGADPLPWPHDPVDANSGLRFAFVGRTEPIAKGQDLLLQALAQPQWNDRPWSLSLFGSGHGTAGVAAMAELLGISHRLHAVPAYSSLEAVWRDHHVLVMPSRYEGLPLALAEAMWLGRPAVVTDVADSGVLVRDGLDGFVASAPTVGHVAEALERLWQHRHQLLELGVSAAARVRHFFPEDPVAAASEQILSLVSR